MKVLKQVNSYLLTFLLCFVTLQVTGHDERYSELKGIVKDADGELIESATVYVKELEKGTLTNSSGKFYLRVRPGEYTVTVQYIGYEPFEKKVKVKGKENNFLHVKLANTSYNLKEVVVESKSPVQRIKETALNVVAIDTKKLYNTNLDIANTLGRVSGVKIREVGGVGSDAQISLNGFSGKYIKVFMDGVPLEGSGSSFQINNIPISLADRIEVYKGVVPVEFGGDALGGAINIVTKQTSNTYVDASYSYGSFNTHRSNVNFGYTAKNGLNVSFTAYQNYSDNDYKVKTKYLDLENGGWDNEERWFKRFHDTYHNEAIMAKIGVVNKSWADKLLFGINLSQESADIQNANIMTIVYGGKKRKSKTITPSVSYSKRNLFVQNLNLSLNAKYNRVQTHNIDTMARQYNWAGEYIVKKTLGESAYTDDKNRNENYHLSGSLGYSIVGKHFFSLNNVFSDFSRKPVNRVGGIDDTGAEAMRRVNRKNVVGLSYKFMPIASWNMLAFAKHYNTTVKGPVDISTTTTAEYVEQEKKSSITGYGFASTYHITKDIQVKASYELAYRLPNERELFGDEVLEAGNNKLKPEKSNNFNFNVMYDKTFNEKHNLSVDAGFAYRVTKDYIRRIIDQSKGGASSVNHGEVNNMGFDFETRYSFKDALSLGANFTYQNLRNQEKYDIYGKEMINYKDRVPNVPYLFGNFDASYTFKNLSRHQDLLTIGYNMHYIHKFFRAWESEHGNISIPQQFSHDLSLTYSLKDGRYNIALEANNFTDETLFDNYSLQKPGRSFSVKLRYFFFRSK